MQTRVYNNPYMATWTHARIDVNAALERATATTSKNLPYPETYKPLPLLGPTSAACKPHFVAGDSTTHVHSWRIGP